MPYCEITLDERNLQDLTYAVRNHYWYQMYIDGLPIWGELTSVSNHGLIISDSQQEHCAKLKYLCLSEMQATLLKIFLNGGTAFLLPFASMHAEASLVKCCAISQCVAPGFQCTH